MFTLPDFSFKRWWLYFESTAVVPSKFFFTIFSGFLAISYGNKNDFPTKMLAEFPPKWSILMTTATTTTLPHQNVGPFHQNISLIPSISAHFYGNIATFPRRNVAKLPENVAAIWILDFQMSNIQNYSNGLSMFPCQNVAILSETAGWIPSIMVHLFVGCSKRSISFFEPII